MPNLAMIREWGGYSSPKLENLLNITAFWQDFGGFQTWATLYTSRGEIWHGTVHHWSTLMLS